MDPVGYGARNLQWRWEPRRNARRTHPTVLPMARAGPISFAEFDASLQGWISPIRYADSWGLRKSMMARLSQGLRGKAD